MAPRRPLHVTAVLALGLLLAGCESVGDLFEAKEERLPGERIAILATDRGLQPDPQIADEPVRLAEPYVNPAWTQAGGSPAHAMYHLALGDSPRRTWSADVGDGSDDDRQLLAQPLVVENVVYAMDSLSLVTAFEAASGRVIWRQDLEPEDEDAGYFGGGIAYDNGRIFVSTGFARVFALDAASGEVLWQTPVAAPMRAAPTATDGRVFVVTLDNETVALAAEDGTTLWTHSGLQEDAGLIGGASPAVSGSTVVAPYSSGEIVGLLAENGRVLWSDSLSAVARIDPLGDIAQIRGAPVIDRGIVFAISHAGRMIAIDLRQGLRAWEAEVGGTEMPWVGGDYVFAVTNDAQLVALTRREGRVRWVLPLPRYEDPDDQEDPIQWAGPVLASDRLILAGSNGQALSVSPYTGELLGAIELPDDVRIAPVVADGALYFVTEGGSLVAYR